MLTTLGYFLHFSAKTKCWGKVELEMKPKGALNDVYSMELLHAMSQDSLGSQQAEERQAKILNTDYSKVSNKNVGWLEEIIAFASLFLVYLY